MDDVRRRSVPLIRGGLHHDADRIARLPGKLRAVSGRPVSLQLRAPRPDAGRVDGLAPAQADPGCVPAQGATVGAAEDRGTGWEHYGAADDLAAPTTRGNALPSLPAESSYL